MPKSVLVLARNAQLTRVLARSLKSDGVTIEVADGGKRARELAHSRRIDLAIVMLEGNDDIEVEVLRDLRASIAELILVGRKNSRASGLRDCLPGLLVTLSEAADPIETARRVRQALYDQGDGAAAAPPASMMLGFDGCILDVGGRSFRDAQGRDVPLGRAQFALLVALVRNAGLVLSREYLRQVVPGRGREAFDRSIDMLVTRLRRKIEPVPKSPRFILSVPGEGYKFNARPHAIAPPDSAARPSARPSAASDLFDGQSAGRHRQRLAIAVLPFADLGDASECNRFGEALTESLTIELSRTPGVIVVDLNPASSDCGKSADIKKLTADVGVGYAVRGSVQLSDERIRLNLQLIDGQSGAHLWAERFDCRRGDLFETLDQIVPRLARSLEIELTTAEARRAANASSSLDSTQLAFCGWDAYNRRRNPSHLRQAERFFTAALARDPENVHALTGLALAKSSHPYYFTDEECGCDFAAAESAALTAAELNPDSAGVRYALSWLYTYSNRAELGLAEAERTLSVNRSNAHAYAVLGMAKVFLGRADEAEHDILRALTLSPRDPFAYVWREFAGAAKLYLGEWDAAAAWFHRAPEAERSHPLHNFFLAAALARQGRSNDARAAVRRGLALAPRFTLRRFQEAPLGNDPGYLAQRERLCEAMREAGVP
jgi:TolB-like protein/DNA-binding response OmpR family regulator/Tfp pilus assembly protein PilF